MFFISLFKCKFVVLQIVLHYDRKKNILTNTQENQSQSGVIDTVISDHSLIYCTRKMLRAKYNRHKEITFHTLKNYSPDVYKGTLEKVSFPNYENFDNPDVAYSDFITRLDCVINVVTARPCI